MPDLRKKLESVRQDRNERCNPTPSNEGNRWPYNSPSDSKVDNSNTHNSMHTCRWTLWALLSRSVKYVRRRIDKLLPRDVARRFESDPTLFAEYEST